MNKIQKLAIVIALPAILVLSACSTQGSTHTDVHASAAPKPSAAAQVDPLLKGFGEVITYKDGVSVSVSKPSEFTSSPESDGAVAGQKDLVFTVVITNNSKANLDVASDDSVASGGQEASFISDIGVNIGFGPQPTLLPGQSIKWLEGYSVADPTDITFSITPSFEYAKAIFDSKH